MGVWSRIPLGDTYTNLTEVDDYICGDTGVLGLWDLCRMCIFDVCIVNTDKLYYEEKNPHQIMSQQDQNKKYKCPKNFLYRWWNFTLLVLFLYGLMVEETKAATKQLGASLSNKCDSYYSTTCGYILSHICLNLVQTFILLTSDLPNWNTHNDRWIRTDGAYGSRLEIRWV